MAKSNFAIDYLGIICDLLTIAKDFDPSASLDDLPSTEFPARTFRFDHSCGGMIESKIEPTPKIQFIRRQFGLWGSNKRDQQDELGSPSIQMFMIGITINGNGESTRPMVL
jgi:hypothetical protein